jgi:hypothetical protein
VSCPVALTIGSLAYRDLAGTPAGPPLSTSDAVRRAVALTAVGWLGAAGLACHGLRVAFDRRRMRGWADEWARFEQSGALGPRG